MAQEWCGSELQSMEFLAAYFLACGNLYGQVKMVASFISYLNGEHCEGWVRVRAFPVGGETAAAEKAALYAAL
jgi:hypothetical protein